MRWQVHVEEITREEGRPTQALLANGLVARWDFSPLSSRQSAPPARREKKGEDSLSLSLLLSLTLCPLVSLTLSLLVSLTLSLFDS